MRGGWQADGQVRQPTSLGSDSARMERMEADLEAAMRRGRRAALDDVVPIAARGALAQHVQGDAGRH
jgi:hypothetical protein